MACPKFLRTDLNPTAQQGGTWTYIGYSSNSPTGPFTDNPLTPLVQVAPGGTLAGDDPLVDPASASAGFYRFRYYIDRLGCTPSQAFITIQVQAAANSGNDFSLSLCSNSGIQSLATLFNTNAGPVSAANVNITGNAAIGSAPSFNFNPGVVGAGTYTFTRTVTRIPQEGFTLACADCTDTSTAIITVSQNASSGNVANPPQLVICDYDSPVSLHDQLLNESTNGNWYFIGAATGAPVYGNTTMTINSNLFNNTTQTIAIGVQISNLSNIATVNLSQAAKGFAYRFRYIVNEGTACTITSTDVILFASTDLLSGTATNETICYQSLSPATAFLIYSWLNGANGNGSWSITTTPARPNKVNANWVRGSQDPFNLNRGADDTFNFQNFRNSASTDNLQLNQRVAPGAIFDFNFTYTAANEVSGVSFGCTPSTTTFTKSIVFTYNPGTPANNANPYTVNCTGNQIFDLGNLAINRETGGWWYVPPTSLEPNSVAIPNLILGSNPQATYQPGSLLTSQTSANVNFTNVPNGTYYFMLVGGTLWSGPNQCPRNLIIRVIKSCCSVNAGITNNTGSTELNCNTSAISLTATGGTTYQWNHGPTTANVTITGPGIYTVTAFDSNGCTGQATVTITENTTPPNGGITNNTGTTVLTCTTNSISVTAFGGGTYQWTGGLGTNANATITQAGTYSVTVTNPTTGCTAVYSITVTQSAGAPAVTITAPTTVLTCSTTSIVLTASGASTYSWSGGGTGPTKTITQAGTYTVTGTGANGCTATASITITSNTTPPAVVISRTPNTTELGCGTNSIVLTASGANSYSWNTGATTASITVTQTGNYSVTGTGTNGCTATVAQVITQAQPPTVTVVSTTGNTQLGCGINSITLQASGAASYSWSTGATGSTITVTSIGTYIVTGTAANGCTATASITITQCACPPTNVTLSVPNNITQLGCGVSSITITASGANSYVWNTGATTPSIMVTTPGVYSVTGTTVPGCTDTESITITQHPCQCNGAQNVYLLRHDLGMATTAGTARIVDFIVNDTLQIPVNGVPFSRLNPLQVSNFNGQCKGCNNEIPQFYNQAVQLALQGLNIPCFEFERPNLNGDYSLTYDLLTGNFGIPADYRTCSEKYVLVKAPSCLSWSLTIRFGGPESPEVTWAYNQTTGAMTVTGAFGALLGTNQVPNTQPCGSGQGNNVIPLGTDNSCP
jgi:hypothetical protein